MLDFVRPSLVRHVAALRSLFAGADDAAFWCDHLFVVSPHHMQIRAIRRALADAREWDAEPFVDTVDRMQGRSATR